MDEEDVALCAGFACVGGGGEELGYGATFPPVKYESTWPTEAAVHVQKVIS